MEECKRVGEWESGKEKELERVGGRMGGIVRERVVSTNGEKER